VYQEETVEAETEFTFEEMEDMPYAKVMLSGKEDRRPYHPKNVWELDIQELISGQIDPLQYFRTTGEAIIKMRKLEADLFQMAGLARKVGNILEKLRGENIYLETQWSDGRLLLKAKNPRKNKEEKAKALQENFEYGKKS
jgi:hypothetical protein